MARSPNTLHVLWIVWLMLIANVAATPPGIANHPSHATCKIKKYKMCYNLVHVCPKFCPNGCTVECASCKPICSDGSNPPPEDSGSPPEGSNPPDYVTPPSGDTPPQSGGTPEESKAPTPPPEDSGSLPEGSNPPDYVTPSADTPPQSGGVPEESKAPPPPSPQKSSPPEKKTPPPPDYVTPPSGDISPPMGKTRPPQSGGSPEERKTPPPPSPQESNPPERKTPPPAKETPSPSEDKNTPPKSSPPEDKSSPPDSSAASGDSRYAPPPPSQDSNPPKSSPSEDKISPPDSSDTSGKNRYAPPPEEVTRPGPPSSWLPTPSTPSTSPKKAKCKNKNYPQCYATEHVCPSSCPGGCVVDCVTCKPVCRCDIPGAVCQDPRFIGGDGITFYFHGKKDRDFCLVSDPNLHINAHFIGRRNQDMKRDFTWVQSIGILFDNHKLYIGAQKTATWNDAVDRLSLNFDDEPIFLTDSEGARWQSGSVPLASIMRRSDTNNVVVEVEGIFKITAKVVPITEEESRVHNYSITKDDCFAHLELGFKFFSLSDEVNGVLGQTYRSDYVTRVNMRVSMPVMGGERDFASSDIFATDCSVSKFQSGKISSSLILELPGLRAIVE